MEQKLPTCGQLERDLSQQIWKLYRDKLQCFPTKITCKLFNNCLAIVVEDARTTIEKILVENYQESEIVRDMNSAINNAVKSEFKTIVREILAVEVNEIMFDSSFESKYVGAVVVLNQPPQVRKRSSDYRLELIKPQDKQYSEGDFNPSYQSSPASITEPEQNM